jgi:hypothetical protein
MIAYVPDAAADLPLIDGFIPGTALILPSQATTLPSSAVDLPHLAVGLPRLAVILPRGLDTVLALEKGCFMLLLAQSKFAFAACKDSNLEFSPEKD